MRQVRAYLVVSAALIFVALLSPRTAAASWPSDPLVNVPVCTAPGDQILPTIASDGAGGAIVAWSDGRTGNPVIYVQRLSYDGTPLWTADGVSLSAPDEHGVHPAIIADGAGGAIVAWVGVLAKVCAQRVSAAGTPLWPAGGVTLSTAGEYPWCTGMVTDGAGGAIVAWTDRRSSSGYSDNVYARRISADGVPLWTSDGVALCPSTSFEYWPRIAPDSAGGAVVAWVDFRDQQSLAIYAQRISAAGTLLWAADGVAVGGSREDSYPSITLDGAGGAIIAWVDMMAELCAQRISAAGTPMWTAGGVLLCATRIPCGGSGSECHAIASDGAGGATIAWIDSLRGIRAQRVSAAGTPLWAANGVALSPAGTWWPRIVPNVGGGTIVAWADWRAGGEDGDPDIYAQRVSPAGTLLWGANGVAVSTALGSQETPVILADGTGGAIVAWADMRGGQDNYDIYAQAVTPGGQLGSVADVPMDGPPVFALDAVFPNPSKGGALTVHFALVSSKAASLELLDIAGRRIAVREVGSLGEGRHVVQMGEGEGLPPGVYLVRLTQGAHTRTARVAVLR